MWIEVHNTKLRLSIVVEKLKSRKAQSPAPVGSLTEAIEDFILDSSTTCTEWSIFGLNIGANDNNFHFTLSSDGNWTF